MVRNFSTALSIMGKTTREKINEEIEDLNNSINKSISQVDLTDIYL